jgi:hypothetical protein
MEEHGAHLGTPRGPPKLSASLRRESAARSIERKHGSVLEAIAKLAFDAPDVATRLRALATLAPYLYPALKAVELTGANGDSLTVEIRKVASVVPPGLTPGTVAANPQDTRGVSASGDLGG